MSRLIFCSKLNQEAEGLDKPPFANAFGEKLYQHISKQAWSMWLSHQTMLINEYRLNLIDPKARAFLFEEMETFFFPDASKNQEEEKKE